MKKIFFISFGITILFFTNACKNSHTKEIATLDSLAQALVKAESSLLEIDSVEIQKSADEVMETLHKIKTELKDSVSKTESDMLFDYRTCAKSFDAFNKNRKYLNDELFLNIQQISDLKKDLKKGIIPEEKAEEYFMTEVSEAQKLLELIDMNIKSTQAELNSFKELKPKVEMLTIKISDAKK